jgi:8-amino-7-oxononanoate synthase
MAAIEIVGREPGRRIELHRRAADARATLRSQGWNLASSESQIIPLVVGEVEAAMSLSASLLEQGILAPAIRPPSVPAGQSLVRISLSHAHTSEMVERLLAALLRCSPSSPRLQ